MTRSNSLGEMTTKASGYRSGTRSTFVRLSHIISFRPTHLDVFGPSGDLVFEIAVLTAYLASCLACQHETSLSLSNLPSFNQVFGIEGNTTAVSESQDGTYPLRVVTQER
jgi:hypothetical protein